MLFRPQNVRTRLTAWYVAVLAGTLLIYCAGTAVLVLHELREELDHLAIDDLESVEGLLTFDSNRLLSFRSDYHDHPYPESAQDRLLEVRAEDGTLLYRNELLGARTLGGIPERSEGTGGGYSVRTIRMPDGTRARVISKRHIIDGTPTLVRVGFSEAIVWQRFWTIAIGMIGGLPLALGLAGVGGYFLARHALNPIGAMARRVHEINAESLDERVEVENPHDELGVLGSALNDTLARLERSFEQLRRFTADASHELRTPLTAIRSVGEVGLKKSGTSDDYREAISSMLEEAGRLGRLVDNLLMVARGEAGQIKLDRKAICLLPFVRDGLSLIEVLAEEKGQTLTIEGEQAVYVQADGAILGQVLVNLTDNAIKNSHPGTPIMVRVLSLEDRTAVIEVRDSGPGIAPEHRQRVFDRFYRTDEGRSRDAGGAGLGLAIAKWGTEAHGGRLELDCPATGGCVFRVILPTIRGTNGAARIEASVDQMSRKLSIENPS